MNLRVSETPESHLLFMLVLTGGVICWFNKRLMHRFLLHPYLLKKKRQYYTIFTAGFVHRQIFHLGINLLLIYAFSFDLEKVLVKLNAGHPAILLIFTAGVLAGNCLSSAVHYKDFKFTTEGASGGTLAILFCYLFLGPAKALAILPLFGAIPNPITAVFCLAVFVYLYFRNTEVQADHLAHIGGSVSGITSALIILPSNYAIW